MPQRLVSKSEYARIRGCTPAYVTKLLKEGRIYEVDGKIDPADADRRISAAAVVASKGGKKPSVPYYQPEPVSKAPPKRLGRPPRKREDDLDDYFDDEEDPNADLREDELPRSHLPDALLRARIKTEREKGMHAELERKRKQGELVDAEEVRSASQSRAVAEREALLAWPRRVSADMAVELGVEERLLLQVQQKYIREFLAERSKQPTKGATPQMDLGSE